MDADLTRYAEREIPRYTSYPTAAEFGPEVDEARYRVWLLQLTGDERVSLYVHVPFCQSLCWYCGCHTSVPNDASRASRYVEALAKEIDMVGAAVPAKRVVHLHFGGGTPTYLSKAELGAVMARLRESFTFLPGAEIAIEIDPRTLSQDKAQALAAAGFNRASLGVQDVNDHVQARIGRIQPFQQVAQSVAWLREAGFGGINMDLMYGLPRQSLHDVEATVRKAASLSPDRVSVFGYAHVPWFKKHQRVIDQADLPGTAERFEQAEAAAGALQARGYARVGFDHFALAADPLAKAAAQGTLRRNFQGYTTDPADLLIGLGASSIGSLPQGFVQNEPHLGKYEAAIAQNRLPVVRGIAVDEDDRLRAEVIERLMCEMKADLGSICAAHGFAPDTLDTAFADLAPLLGDGLVTRQDRTIAVTEKGRALVRNVAACFDTYLAAKQHGSKHSRAV